MMKPFFDTLRASLRRTKPAQRVPEPKGPDERPGEGRHEAQNEGPTPVGTAEAHEANEMTGNAYFTLARSWADDFYTQAILQRNRWKAICLYALVPLSSLLLLCVVMLIPAERLVPILVNHYGDGQVAVTPLKPNAMPTTDAEVQSELVRYVVNRESYSAHAFTAEYKLINALSSNAVATVYRNEQSASNKAAPINTLGQTGTRSVQVQSVVFLDNAGDKRAGARRRHNLAQVDFTVTERNAASGREAKTPLTALISWTYRGTPTRPKALWQNWDGFTVTAYTVQQRNV